MKKIKNKIKFQPIMRKNKNQRKFYLKNRKKLISQLKRKSKLKKIKIKTQQLKRKKK